MLNAHLHWVHFTILLNYLHGMLKHTSPPNFVTLQKRKKGKCTFIIFLSPSPLLFLSLCGGVRPIGLVCPIPPFPPVSDRRLLLLLLRRCCCCNPPQSGAAAVSPKEMQFRGMGFANNMNLRESSFHMLGMRQKRSSTVRANSKAENAVLTHDWTIPPFSRALLTGGQGGSGGVPFFRFLHSSSGEIHGGSVDWHKSIF